MAAETITTFTCDRCGAEASKAGFFNAKGAPDGWVLIEYEFLESHISGTKLWCWDCRKVLVVNAEVEA